MRNPMKGMWRPTARGIAVMGLVLLMGAAAALAEGQQSGTAPEAAQPPAPIDLVDPLTPQGPGPINEGARQVDPGAIEGDPGAFDAFSGAGQLHPDIVGYMPIPETALPGGANAGTRPGPATGATMTNLGTPVYTLGPYTLGRDDVIHIVARGQPEFSGTYAIGHDGKIQYGFVGDLEAAGLTKEQLRQVVVERLKQYVRVPVVQVTIAAFNSKAIYVLGRVARPGKYAMRGDTIKVRDAVIAAGLVVRHAKLRRVHIVKSDPNDPSYRVVDLQKVLYQGKMKQNVDLVNGDIVVIPTTVWGGINDFLSELVSPAGHAGSAAALATL